MSLTIGTRHYWTQEDGHMPRSVYQRHVKRAADELVMAYGCDSIADATRKAYDATQRTVALLQSVILTGDICFESVATSLSTQCGVKGII